MRRSLALVVVLALALPFAAAFGAPGAPCCRKGVAACALRQKASCAPTCSMGAAQPADTAALPHDAARQAMTAFELRAPAAAVSAIEPAAIRVAAAHRVPPDPPPPRA